MKQSLRRNQEQKLFSYSKLNENKTKENKYTYTKAKTMYIQISQMKFYI